MKEMDALVWLGPRQMELRRQPLPSPAAEELLLQVETAGICGSELSGYLGHNSLRTPPLVMGHEAAGRITQVAGGMLADGTEPKVGQRVTFNPLVTCGACDRCRARRENLCRNRVLIGAHRPGAFSAFVAVPAKNCYPMPEPLGDVAAAIAEPVACGVRTSVMGEVAPGKSVAIVGAGFIGLCCLAAAREAGAKNIFIFDISDRRLDIARRWGAKEAVNSKKEDLLAAVQKLQPGGVDVAIDAVGTAQTRDQSIRAAVPGGRVVFIGLHEEESKIAANYVVRQETTIVGSFAYTPRDFEKALSFLKTGVVTPDKAWLQERPLAEGKAAFDELVDGTNPASKVVLRVSI